MPTMRLGSTSSHLGNVLRAFEQAVGLPPGSGGDTAWLRTLLDSLNKANGTDIAYVREDYGYHFSYNSPQGAMILGAIKEQNKL